MEVEAHQMAIHSRQLLCVHKKNNPPGGGWRGGGPPGGGSGPHFAAHGSNDSRKNALRCKDFLGIDKFDGDLRKFADWSDRMRGKIAKSSRHYRNLLFGVAANITTMITSQVEQSLSTRPV